MSTPQISVNPMLTSNAANTFGIDWSGGFVGKAMPDPATRNALAGGILDANESLPMWGGVAISEYAGGVTGILGELGSDIKSPTTVAQITGFSTFDQGHAGIATPQSPVPLYYPGMQVMFYRKNSGARLWLPASANLTFTGGTTGVGSNFSWDFVGRQVVPYVAAFSAQVPTSGTYVSGTGVLTLNFATAPVVAAGNWVGLSGFTGTAAQLNGQSFQVLTYTATTQVTLQLPTGLTITNSDLTTGTTVAGGGALPVQAILKSSLSKSISVSYAPSTGLATWNRTGSAVLALI